MTVRIVCGCGQVLRLAEGLPDYLVLCPVCGKPVRGTPLPDETPTTRPSAGGDKPRRRRPFPPPAETRTFDPTLSEEPALPLEPVEEPGPGLEPDEPRRQLSAEEEQQVRRWLGEARQEIKRKRSTYRSWGREKHWYECALFPVRAGFQIALLALGWATWTPFASFLLPQGWEVLDLLPWLPSAGVFLALLSYTSAFLWNVLRSAVEGEAGVIPWPDRNLPHIARAGGVSLACFLAGPAVPALVGFLFWLRSGDLALIDTLILLELALLAVGSWAVLTVTVWHSGRLADACPAGIVRLWQRRGFLPIGTALVGSLWLLAHAEWVLRTLALFRQSPPPIWFLMVLEWASCLAGLILLLRWLGLMMYRRDRAQKKQAKRFREDEAVRREALEDAAGELLLDREVATDEIQDLGSSRPSALPPLRDLPESSDPDRRSTRVT